MSETFQPEKHAVLVVEDDLLLLHDAMDMVEETGLKAYGARNAERAIQLLEQHRDIRILFTDIEMDGSMDGLKLARVVRDRWPPVAIIVTSGRVTVTKDDMPEHGVFFAKPYPPKSLVNALNEISAKLTD